MHLYAPDYYKNFSCIADRCRHSCCIGWEIDIDDESYAAYQKIGGDFGDRLQQAIALEDETPHFCLTKDERCPFLNQSNLCDIILQLGEGALCQICTDHPRFRNFFDSREELGLGLCCEAAAALILTRKEPFRLVALHTDAESEYPEETAFFSLRERIFAILQNRNKGIEERMTQLTQAFDLALPDLNYTEWADVFWQLERLDSTWVDRLAELKEVPELPPSLFAHDIPESAWEQLLVYFVYRHMAEGFYDGRLRARLAFALLGVKMLQGLCASHALHHGTVTLEDLIDLARQYSSEVEYSEGNMEVLLDFLER